MIWALRNINGRVGKMILAINLPVAQAVNCLLPPPDGLPSGPKPRAGPKRHVAYVKTEHDMMPET
jgi:hypothetical protein